jgi:hypothetical protein
MSHASQPTEELRWCAYELASFPATEFEERVGYGWVHCTNVREPHTVTGELIGPQVLPGEAMEAE